MTLKWMLVQSILCDRQVLGTIQFPKYIQLNWYFILGAVRPTSPPAATSERTGFLQVPCLICEPCNTQWCLQSCPMPNLRQLKQTCVVKNIFYHEKQKTQKFKTKSSMAGSSYPYIDIQWHQKFLDTPLIGDTSPFCPMSYVLALSLWMSQVP